MKRYQFRSTPRVLLLSLFLLAGPGTQAQTIETLPLDRTTLCATDSITVRFRTTGDSWQTFNEFVLEVSRPDGTFGSGTRKIGRLRSIAPDEIEEIGARIPDDFDPEGVYRFRVSATRPLAVGSDNGQDIRILPLAIAQFGLPGFIGITGKTMEITSYISGGSRVEWDFGEGAVPASSDEINPPPIRFQTPGNKRIRMTAFNEAGCPYTRVVSIDIFENHPRIPANTSIRKSLDGDTLDNTTLTNHIWICPDESLTFDHRLNIPEPLTIYVEPGASVLIEETGVRVVAYVKRGGSLIIRGARADITGIVYENQAFIDVELPYNTFYVEADSIGFDYSEAPAHGCRPESSVVGVDPQRGTDENPVWVAVRSDGNILEGSAVEVGSRITDVTLYDIRGERLLRQEVGTGAFTLPLPDLPPGPYLVVVNSTAGIVHRRIHIPH